MLSLNFQFPDKGQFWKNYDIDVSYFDPEGEEFTRSLIVNGIKKYRTCETIIAAIGHTQINIVCNKGVGNWYDNDTNAVFFDRTHKSLPHLVSGGTDYTIPALVCLFHELGHAKQCYQNKIWYTSAVTIKDEMGVSYMIEYDNLHKHEDPLLREMGLPIRKKYEFYVSEAEAERIVKRGQTTQ